MEIQGGSGVSGVMLLPSSYPLLLLVLLAFILIADTGFLKKLKGVVPDLAITIDTLLIHRRHGSQLIFMQLQELVEIKDKVYDTSRILLEASNE